MREDIITMEKRIDANILNEDFISVVRKNNTEIEYIEVEIEKEHQELLSKIHNMSEDDNCCLLDIQTCFTNVFTGVKSYSYCLPYPYCDTFVDPVTFPRIFSSEEYYNELQKVRQDYISKEKEIIDNKKEKEEIDDNQYKEALIQIETDADDFVKARINKMKVEFKERSERYIHAYDFYKALDKVKADRHNIMYSTETIGWTNYNYRVNDDINIIVKTNFCYGRSSYFHFTIEYKGVIILSYPRFVQYYYADMLDFIDCTVAYGIERNNWKYALSFVVEQANLAIRDANAFIHKWIIDGTSKMIQRLKKIYESPNEVLDVLLKDVDEGTIYTVRNITKEELSFYKIYRNEMTVAFQAEKITGSLLFIPNLNKFSGMYEEISPIIKQIECINKDFFPILYHTDISLEKKIAKQEDILENLEKEYQAFQKEHNCIFQEFKKYETQALEGEDPIHMYMESHPGFEFLFIKKQSYERQIESIKEDVNRLVLFHTQLSRCAQLVCDYGLADIANDDYLGFYTNKAQELLAIEEGDWVMSRDKRRIFKYKYSLPIPKAVIIPNSARVLCNYVFSGKNIQSIKIPSGLKRIGRSAFQDCHHLQEVILPDSVETICDYAFFGCRSLRKIELSSSMKEIAQYSFADCVSLCEIVIPKSVERIGSDAFTNCCSLETITFHSPTIKGDMFIFNGCNHLKTVYIPKGSREQYRMLLLWLNCEVIEI